MKKVLAVIVSLCLALSLAACNFSEELAEDIIDATQNFAPVEKTFEFDGLSIRLNTDFIRVDVKDEDFDFAVGDGKVSVFGIKVDFEGELDEYSVEDFAELYRREMQNMNLDPSEITAEDKIPTVEYVAAEEGTEYTNIVKFYKANNCFWVVVFSVESEDCEALGPDVGKYAASVECFG